ncbi:lytic polysaccharide monooxygenase auxiliary activity family 9 protein [Streptomyces olivochromogenes]|uniref:Chitin-binding protein n=1 Tax=Streptomyces olivochromogenes TaxID=1963 RepID=A0A250VF39_STROL|nr:lytic polysaccharide monooxygenase [Streptomyces olivochromogenes]KUN47863.1 chitin-binding protein [Streptomyces olivochromogenes]GAX52666.1 chitin-binding protein [Streptomyces olivochromogenes]
MSARRKAAVLAVAVGVAPVALTALAAAPAVAHGTMGDPVSRVFQCYAENPESPKSSACEAAVATGGTQALYDWNGIRIGDANGGHQRLIPDGKLCSAGNDEFKGLDLARADWPTTSVSGGAYTFKYRVTAPHKGTFDVYITKAGYDPSKPLAWADLDLAHPVATKTDPVATNGYYTFSGTLPQRSGRQLLYAIWQRSDSPEAFYSCSDVTFGGGGSGNAGAGGDSKGSSGTGTGSTGTGSTGTGSTGSRSTPAPTTPAPTASAPSERQIADGADKSTVRHDHHDGTATAVADTSTSDSAPGGSADRPEAAGVSERHLAETGGDSSSPYLAIGGAGALALGAAALFSSVRRRATGDDRRGR